MILICDTCKVIGAGEEGQDCKDDYCEGHYRKMTDEEKVIEARKWGVDV